MISIQAAERATKQQQQQQRTKRERSLYITRTVAEKTAQNKK
jgi:hypothetical protein